LQQIGLSEKKFMSLYIEFEGWAKQLNLISWKERDPKYDIRERSSASGHPRAVIREWSPDGEKMVKRVTLSKEELVALKELLNTMDL